MKRILSAIVVTFLWVVAWGQCYEPNLQKADAAYARGDYQTAYNYYRNASKCPDAKRFENGKKAKAGMQKCQPVLKIDGQQELNLIVGKDSGQRTFKITHAKLDSDGWKVKIIRGNCTVVNEDHRGNMLTIKWEGCGTAKDQELSFCVYGTGIDYISATVRITQRGFPYLPQGERYDTIIKGSSGISTVVRRDKYGFLDSAGNAITPLKYERYGRQGLESWGKNTMLMCVGAIGKSGYTEYGFIDQHGIERVPLKYDRIVEDSLKYGISTSVVKRNGKYGLISGYGNEVIPCEYDDFVLADSQIEPIAFKKGNKYAFFYRSGEQLTEFKYDSVSPWMFQGHTRRCLVKVNNKCGYIDTEGKEVILPQFDKACDFGDNNRAIVEINGKWCCVNQNGKIIIREKNKNTAFRDLPFMAGTTWVKDEKGFYQIDVNGKRLGNKSYKYFYYRGRIKDRYDTYSVVANTQGDSIYVANDAMEYRSKGLYEQDFIGLEEAANKGIEGALVEMYKWKFLSDPVQGFKWCKKAAECGHPEVMVQLAIMYYGGRGCKKDYGEAYKWFLKAANEINGEAMCWVGWMLWYGQGCTEDKKWAVEWEKTALLAGYDAAINSMKRAGMDMSALKPY